MSLPEQSESDSVSEIERYALLHFLTKFSHLGDNKGSSVDVHAADPAFLLWFVVLIVSFSGILSILFG